MVLAVSEALGNSLSADRAIRNRGEQALAMLETNEGSMTFRRLF